MTRSDTPSDPLPLFDIAPFGIAVLNSDGCVLDANPAFQRLAGCSLDELRGRSPADVAAPGDRPHIAAFLCGDPAAALPRVRLQHPDGSEVCCRLTSSVVETESGLRRVLFVQDASEQALAEQEQKRLAAQVQQAQKMEAIGTLAGGIAHDFNNLLMAIQGSVSLLLLDKAPEHRDLPYLKKIEKTVARASELTKQVLGFARGGAYEKTALDLNAVVRECAGLFGRSERSARVRLQLAPDLWSVEADAGQIRQALVNLLVNAGQAMPGGGDIDLRTENIVVDARDPEKPPDAPPGAYARVTVADTGAGIPPELQRRIFEPFFTTREKGKHSGLGLSSTFGIVKAHGGYLTVHSEPEHGATFALLLPAFARATQPRPIPTVPVRIPRRVLLVEDEALVLEVGSRMLERLGHSVVTARSGPEAIELYGRDPGAIDLVILDMIMPGMGGGAVFEALKAIRPDVAVLLSSGYSLNGQSQDILQRGCRGFIQKPFNLEQLDRKIREVAGP